jgi:hypothetical protein
MKKTAVFLFVAGVALSEVMAQGGTPNYVRTISYVDENGYVPVTSVSFSDGLGRPIQSQLKLSDTTCLVSGTYYDSLGRATKAVKSFLYNPGRYGDQAGHGAPNTFLDMTNEVLVLLANCYYSPSHIAANPGVYPYSETKYYNDPLGRTKESGSPGVMFSIASGHTSKIWSFGTTSGVYEDTLIDTNGFIKAQKFQGLASKTAIVAYLNALGPGLGPNPNFFLSVAMNQNDSITQAIKDIFGKTVKTWACAAGFSHPVVAGYAYGITGNLLNEIPPKDASQPLLSTKYRYNTLGQLVSKTLPGIGTDTPSVLRPVENYQYDNTGRLIKVIRSFWPGNQESLMVAYDTLGRAVSKRKQPAAVKDFDVVYFYDGIASMSPANRGKFMGYVDRCKMTPTEQDGLVADLANDDNARGRMTAAVSINKVPVSQDDSINYSSGHFLYYVMDCYVYDDEGRVLRHYKSVPSLPLQKFSYTYDFTGKLLADTLNAASSRRLRLYNYDEQGRLSIVYDNYRDDGHKLVSYEYDGVGNMVKKRFYRGNQASGNYGMDFQYNIRDWLTSIASTETDQTNSFKELVDYENSPLGYGNVPQYNGNISLARYYYGTEYNVGLTYHYDALNRLVKSDAAGSPGQPSFNPINYNEQFSYDDVGRISSKRVQKSGTARTYDYYTSSSRLKKVSHQGDSAIYLYDFYGNMLYDASKKMVVSYDWRNLPVKFSFYSTAFISTGAFDKPVNNRNGTVTSGEIAVLCHTHMPVSEVIMLYDADGNRVVKLERKL